MKVCLVNPPDPVVEDPLWDEPLGLLYLAAILEQRGIDVEVLDLNFHRSLLPLLQVDATHFGVYCSSSLLESTLKVNRLLKLSYPDAVRIVGGPHATCLPDEMTQHFDKVVVGEGERALAKILKGRTRGQIVKCPPIENPDHIPYPARHLVPIHGYHRRVGGAPSTGIITARGCPYRCAFCSKVWGQNARFRSAENILGEVEECIAKYGITAFSIRDDTFTLNRERLQRVLDGFKELNVVWRCLTRVDHVNREILLDMKVAGCVEIVYGIEAGSQIILDNLGKGTAVEQNREAIRLTMEAGIHTKAAVIIGSPGETWGTVYDTIDFIEANPPDEVIVCLFTPYPGSPVWDNPEAFGMRILTRDVSKYAAVGPGMTGNVVVETEAMSARDISDAHKAALKKFRELGLMK